MLNVVAVVRVATVDDRVVVLEDGLQLVDHLLHDRGGHHDPDVARALHLGDEIGNRGGADRALSLELLDGGIIDVEDDAGMAIAHQAADEVGAHPAKADHAELHWVLSSHVSLLALAALECAVAAN